MTRFWLRSSTYFKRAVVSSVRSNLMMHMRLLACRAAACAAAAVPTVPQTKKVVMQTTRNEEKEGQDTMKYAKPKRPVVPQMGGGCFMDCEVSQAQAICCLRSDKGAQSSGTLVRFTKDGAEQVALLTCHHVIPSRDAPCRQCSWWNPPSRDGDHLYVRPENTIVSSKELDYALVGVEWHAGLPTPIDLTLPRRRVFAGCAVRTVGFARNMPLRCMYGVVTGAKRNKFYSTSAHEPGMSGAPVFVDGEFVGIHTGYFEATDEASNTYIGAILSDIFRGSASSKEMVDEAETSGGAAVVGEPTESPRVASAL